MFKSTHRTWDITVVSEHFPPVLWKEGSPLTNFTNQQLKLQPGGLCQVVEDDEFDQFVEEEEVIYVNDGFKMSRDKDGYFYENLEYEDN